MCGEAQRADVPVAQLLHGAPGPQKAAHQALRDSFHRLNVVGKTLQGKLCIRSFTSTGTSAAVIFGTPVRTEFWTDGVHVNDSILPMPSQYKIFLRSSRLMPFLPLSLASDFRCCVLL